MSVLLYAITEAQSASARGDGLDGRPLRALTQEGLSAVVSDVEDEPTPDEGRLWAYEQVVERLMANAPLLPARFNTIAGTEAEITAMLTDRRVELTEALGRVREAVEFAVRPASPNPDEAGDDPDPSGTAYIKRLLAKDRPIRELDKTAAGLFRAKQRTAYGTAYLVDHTRAEEFVAIASEQGLNVTGPWPPYSFTTAS